MINIKIKWLVISSIKRGIKRVISKLFKINNCYNCDRLGKDYNTCAHYCHDYSYFTPINKHSIAKESVKLASSDKNVHMQAGPER